MGKRVSLDARGVCVAAVNQQDLCAWVHSALRGGY